jgi:transposase
MAEELGEVFLVRRRRSRNTARMQSDKPVDGEVADRLIPKPGTLEQCHQVIETLVAHNEQLRDRLVCQEEQMALLQEQVKLNSRNSSKPPSSDGPSRPNRAQRRASTRKRGAQKGHPGAYRKLLPEAQVDAIHDCRVTQVCECGAAVQERGQPWQHQVFDAPAVKARVDEYRLYSGVCTGCGKSHRAALPLGVPSGQIGPRALAIVGLLGTRCHLTQGKTRDLLAQLMGVDFSIGAISQAQGKVALALATPVALAASTLARAAVVYMDETQYPREGTSGNWVWAVVTPKVVSFNILPSRARYVAHDLIGTEPQAVVVSDRYAVYDYIPADKRQVCWAHLLRDFTRIAERSGQPGRIGRRLLGLGYVMFRWRERGAKDFDPVQRRVRAALELGAAQLDCSRSANTCANLIKLWPAMWTFLKHAGVEPTNNAAEQALRGIVLKRKISGPTRSRRGDEFIARGFSVMESCRRQGRDLLDYLHQSVVAWIDQTTPPSLVPTG